MTIRIAEMPLDVMELTLIGPGAADGGSATDLYKNLKINP